MLIYLCLLVVFFADNTNFRRFENNLKTMGCDVFHVFFADETINNIEQLKGCFVGKKHTNSEARRQKTQVIRLQAMNTSTSVTTARHAM